MSSIATLSKAEDDIDPLTTNITYKLDVFLKFAMQWELFTTCEPGTCVVNGVLCEKCLKVQRNHEIFLVQPLESKIIIRPGVFFTYFPTDPLMVPYMTIFSGLHLVFLRMLQVCDPQVENLYDIDPRWPEWLRKMKPAREIAHLLMRKQEAYLHMKCSSAFLTNDRLEIIRAMEMQIGYGECVMNTVNEVKLDNLDRCDVDTLFDTVCKRWKVWKRMHCSQRLMFMTDGLCEADNYASMALAEAAYNKKHKLFRSRQNLTAMKAMMSLKTGSVSAPLPEPAAPFPAVAEEMKSHQMKDDEEVNAVFGDFLAAHPELGSRVKVPESLPPLILEGKKKEKVEEVEDVQAPEAAVPHTDAVSEMMRLVLDTQAVELPPYMEDEDEDLL